MSEEDTEKVWKCPTGVVPTKESKAAHKQRKLESQIRRQELSERDPCSREGKMSMKCLDVNFYDRSMCEKEFENYRACKKFWGKIRWERLLSGKRPLIPPPEEREAVKKEYKHLLHRSK